MVCVCMWGALQKALLLLVCRKALPPRLYCTAARPQHALPTDGCPPLKPLLTAVLGTTSARSSITMRPSGVEPGGRRRAGWGPGQGHNRRKRCGTGGLGCVNQAGGRAAAARVPRRAVSATQSCCSCAAGMQPAGTGRSWAAGRGTQRRLRAAAAPPPPLTRRHLRGGRNRGRSALHTPSAAPPAPHAPKRSRSPRHRLWAHVEEDLRVGWGRGRAM